MNKEAQTFLNKGMMLLHKQAAGETEKRLSTGEPTQAIADVVGSVVRSVEAEMGNDLEPDVVIPGAIELLMQVIELYDEITKGPVDKKLISEALRLFFQQYFESEMEAGRVTQEDLTLLENASYGNV
jgi:hypothetical protein